MHKKRDVYVFLCLWVQFLGVKEMLERWFDDGKVREKLVYVMLVEFLGDCTKGVVWYESRAMGREIGEVLKLDVLGKSTRILEEIDAEITNMHIADHNHF